MTKKITCTCGSSVGPSYKDKIFTTAGVFFFVWECCFCGQVIKMKAPEDIEVPYSADREINLYNK